MLGTRVTIFSIICKQMAEHERWKWQEPGTTWEGVGLYHITLTIPERKPLLGMLDVSRKSLKADV